jgi:hypothetical protein
MKKNKIKGLKALAERLPKSKEIIIGSKHDSIIKKGYEFSMEEIEKSAMDIEAEKDYEKRQYKILDINHLNRLQKAYGKKGEKGIIDYINWLDNNNKKMNEQFHNMQLAAVSKEIMEVAKKGEKGFWSNLFNFLFAFLTVFKNKKLD